MNSLSPIIPQSNQSCSSIQYPLIHNNNHYHSSILQVSPPSPMSSLGSPSERPMSFLPSSSPHLPHPHLHPLHPLNHPIHHRLPLPIHFSPTPPSNPYPPPIQSQKIQLIPRPPPSINLHMFNVHNEYLPQLMSLPPVMIQPLQPLQHTPCPISSAFKPYLTTPLPSTNQQGFFYFPPTPAESNADSEDDKSQISSDLTYKDDQPPQMDCPKLEAQPILNLDDEDIDEAPPTLTPPPELNREIEMENGDLQSIKLEVIDHPKWDLPKPIPQKTQMIIQIESIEPTPPVTPEDKEDLLDQKNPKTPSSIQSSAPSISPPIIDKEERRFQQLSVIIEEIGEKELIDSTIQLVNNENLLIEKPAAPKRVHSKERKSLPMKRRRPLEMTDYEGKCQWADCGYEAEGTNLLYDHVLNEHLLPLSSHCSSTPSTSGISREGSVISDSSSNPSNLSNTLNLLQIPQQPIPRRRGSPIPMDPIENGGDSDSDDQVDPLGCQWADCDMCLTRGDSDRKYQWLRDHFRTRHAKGAQTYKCILEGCNARFHTNRQLEDHVRVTHIQPANANSHRKDRKPGDIWKRTLREMPSDFPLGTNPFYSSFHHSQLVSVVHKLERLGHSAFLEFSSPKDSQGAKWRKTKISSKRRLSNVFEGLVRFKIPEIPIKMEIDEDRMNDEEREGQKRRLSSIQFREKLLLLKERKEVDLSHNEMPLQDLINREYPTA